MIALVGDAEMDEAYFERCWKLEARLRNTGGSSTTTPG